MQRVRGGRTVALATLVGLVVPVTGAVADPGDLVISEIMYNPASAEDDWEWVEVANTGSTAVSLSGWVLDDHNSDAHAEPNIPFGSVPAGGTAVLYNADDLDEGDVAEAWGTGVPLVPVVGWSDHQLNNGGDTVSLWSTYASYAGDHQNHANAVVTVAYDDSGAWPSDDNSGSIYLEALDADPNDGGSWALSAPGASTPAGGAAYTSAAAAGNSGADVGSPGGTLAPPPGPTEVTIPQIQGAAHTSPYEGDEVATQGVVTAVDGDIGFYLQDAVGDGDEATSDAVFVFARDVDVAVGDVVDVTGRVSEFTPGGTGTRNLSTTQVSASDLLVTESGADLPEPVRIGDGGRVPPTEVIDDDALTSFDAATDGLDMYESLEAMRVTVAAPTAVAGTSRFGEIFAVPAGVEPTQRSLRGTLNVSPDDFNPERIQIDPDGAVFPLWAPTVDTGARLTDVTGVVGYSFGNFEVIPTEAFSLVEGGDLESEHTAVHQHADKLTIATYNVLNLDPADGEQNRPDDVESDDDVADGRFDAIAAHVVDNLGSPNVVALQEVQDNSGTSDDGTTAADATLQLLVDRIAAAGGPPYAYIDNPFIADGTSGGVPGGNIRTAFLYDPARVTPVGGPEAVVDPHDQQTDRDSAFWDTRPPLAQRFAVGDDEVVVVNVHLSSKGGSAPLYGTEQDATDRQEDPSVNGSLDERRDQAEAVRAYVEDLTTAHPDEDVIVLGDFNEFEFISPLDQILAGPLVNLTMTLDPDERYSYVFEGNSQSLDHILVTPGLVDQFTQFDAVHVNAEFAAVDERASDHDPLVASLALDPTPDICKDGWWRTYGYRNQGRCAASTVAADPAGR